ncbi:MAG: LysR family transcriptional regulator [Hyphomicrobiales bacterium]|nr:LysR family transcriptional regulator [Hyphomicrobiales bacterium]
MIGSLEETLGFPLFQRLAGRLRPTPEARIIFDEVEKALANLNHISRLMEDIQDKKAGHLRVACLPGFATSLLPRVLAGFLKERPGLALTFEPRTPEKIQEWISAQQFNVGISDMFEETPSIESEPIHVRTVFVAPRGHPLATKTVVTPKDLDRLPIIHGNRNQITYTSIRKAFNSAGAEFNSVVETRLFASACIMVVEGFGVSIVSEIDAREYEKQGLVIRPFEPAIPFHINILYPAYMPRSIATREFVEVFKQSLKPFCL